MCSRQLNKASSPFPQAWRVFQQGDLLNDSLGSHLLHLLFDKHYAEQSKLIDEIAERIQILGGVRFSPP